MVTKTKDQTTWNGLKRSPLKQKSQLKSTGGGLRKISKRQLEIKKLWKSVSFQRWLEVEGKCEICGELVHMETPGHHKEKRRANNHSILNCMILCWTCHHKVETNPAWAKERGYWK